MQQLPPPVSNISLIHHKKEQSLENKPNNTWGSKKGATVACTYKSISRSVMLGLAARPTPILTSASFAFPTSLCTDRIEQGIAEAKWAWERVRANKNIIQVMQKISKKLAKTGEEAHGWHQPKNIKTSERVVLVTVSSCWRHQYRYEQRSFRLLDDTKQSAKNRQDA